MSEDRRYFIGLDLGQTSDPTAVAVLDRPAVLPPPAEKPFTGVWWAPPAPATPAPMPRPAYQLRHLQRFPLMTAYTAIVAQVVALVKTPPLPGCVLAVDQTGVGRAVVDMLVEALQEGGASCVLLPVTITAGKEVTVAEGGGWRVPKVDLCGALQVLLSSRRLKIAKGLPEADVLVKELHNFKVKVTATARETYEAWREGEHDDLVLTAALAAWSGEQCLAAECAPDGEDVTVIRTG